MAALLGDLDGNRALTRDRGGDLSLPDATIRPRFCDGMAAGMYARLGIFSSRDQVVCTADLVRTAQLQVFTFQQNRNTGLGAQSCTRFERSPASHPHRQMRGRRIRSSCDAAEQLG